MCANRFLPFPGFRNGVSQNGHVFVEKQKHSELIIGDANFVKVSVFLACEPFERFGIFLRHLRSILL